MSYILSSIIRTKKLTNNVSELLYKRPMHYRYKPGDKVYLRDYNKYYYIASGVQEPWARILIDNDLYIAERQVRVDREPTNDIPSFIGTEPPMTVFICNELGIAPCLSFCSTFPNDKLAKILAISSGKLANMEWLNMNQDVIIKRDIDNIYDSIPIENNYNYYICMSDKENTLIKDYLLNQGVSDSVMFISSI